jgi:signal transduction histidine kinase
VRNISHNLSPSTLRYYGLAAAINEHCTIINQSGKLEIALANNAEQDIRKTATANIYRAIPGFRRIAE